MTVRIPRSVRGQLWDNTDWLGTWWPAAGAVGLAAVCVLVLVVLRRRRWPAVCAAAALTLSLVAFAATAANAVSGYVPSVDALAVQVTSLTGGGGASASTSGRSTVGTVTISAPPALGITETQAWVYTPPGYDQHPTQRYPVAYLIHGSPGHAPDWFAAGGIAHQMDVLIAAHLIRPMIVVAPDVNGAGLRDSECLNATHGPQVETYLDDVVLPYVDRHYRTAADWQHRVIGGMSSGGYCALDQGLRHPTLYASIIALEPYGDPGAGGRAAIPGDPGAFAAHSPSHYIPRMTFTHPVHVFLDEGSKSAPSARARLHALASQLRERGQPVTTRLEKGHGHSWLEAAEGVPYGLIMASRAMPGPATPPG